MNIDDIYTKNNSTLYIKDLVHFLIEKYNLEDYVRILNIYEEFNKAYNAAYYLYKKEIDIHLDSIRVSFDSMNYYIYRQVHGSKEYNDMYSLYLMDNILHELSHAMQHRELDYDKNDSINAIIKEDYEHLNARKVNRKDKLFYKIFYNYILTERNANCNSKKLLILLNDEYHFLNENQLGFVCYEYKKIGFDEDYDIETRKSWGLKLM